MVPAYDFGFTILTASATSSNAWEDLTNVIAAKILPVLEQVGREQAKKRFTGTYTSSTLNSSLTLVIDGQPGLKVTQWISNGTDLKGTLFVDALLGSDFRLIPNELYGLESGKIGFTGVYQVPKTKASNNSTDFFLECASWFGVSSLTYGNIGLEQFVFEINGGNGDARSVASKALRIEMDKSSSQRVPPSDGRT